MEDEMKDLIFSLKLTIYDLLLLTNKHKWTDRAKIIREYWINKTENEVDILTDNS